jgi:hypothetical protein
LPAFKYDEYDNRDKLDKPDNSGATVLWRGRFKPHQRHVTSALIHRQRTQQPY